MLEAFLTAVGTFIIVVLVLLMTFFITRQVAGISKISSGTRYIKIIDKVPVAQDKFIAIARVCDKYFLVGISANSVSLIKELENADIENFELPQEKDIKANFLDIFNNIKNKNDK